MLVVHDHHRARVLEPGEVIKIIVLAIMRSLRNFVAREQDRVSGLQLFGEGRTPRRERFRPAQILDCLAIGILRRNRLRQHAQKQRNSAQNNDQGAHTHRARKIPNQR